MATKGRAVMDLLGLDHLGTEFCLPPRLASHPTAWLVRISGLLYDARTLPVELQAAKPQLNTHAPSFGHPQPGTG
jgi:hypothetical protein